jgi:hypothetical protein
MDYGYDPKFLWLVGSCSLMFFIAWAVYEFSEKSTWPRAVANWIGELALLGLWVAMIGVLMGDTVAGLTVLGCASATYFAKTTEGFCKGLF